MKDRIARSLFWVVWLRGAAQLVSFLSTLLVARLLSPADYGLMALATIWTSTLTWMTGLGLGPAIVQFPEPDERELNACFWLAMGTTGLGYLALYASAPAIAAWFAHPMLSEVLRVAGLSLPLAALRVVPDSLLRKRLELDRIAQAEVASMLVTIPVVVGMAWSGAGVWALVAGSLVIPLVQNIVSFWFVRWWPGRRVWSPRLPKILRYSVTAVGSRVSWDVYQGVDSFILGKIAGDAVLGSYSMAKQIAMLPVEKVSVLVNQFAVPVLAGLQDDRGAMRASFMRGLRFVACLTVPLCVGMALVADDFVSVMLGDKWMPMVPLLRVLCAFSLVHAFSVLLWPVLFARYRTAFVFWWNSALALIMSFAFWAGTIWLGALGAALALVVIYPIMTARLAREALAELEVAWKAVWHQVRPSMQAALLLAACCFAVRWSISGSEWPASLLRLGLASGAGALAYALGIFWRGGPLAREIAEVAGWLLRRGDSLTVAK